MDNEKTPIQKLQYRFDELSKRFGEKCTEIDALNREIYYLKEDVISLKCAIADCFIEKIEMIRLNETQKRHLAEYSEWHKQNIERIAELTKEINDLTTK